MMPCNEVLILSQFQNQRATIGWSISLWLHPVSKRRHGVTRRNFPSPQRSLLRMIISIFAETDDLTFEIGLRNQPRNGSKKRVLLGNRLQSARLHRLRARGLIAVAR